MRDRSYFNVSVCVELGTAFTGQKTNLIGIKIFLKMIVYLGKVSHYNIAAPVGETSKFTANLQNIS